MQGMDGFDVLETLRQDPQTRSLPVVVHTSKSLDDDDHARLSSTIDIIPKSIMSSRELAVSRFTQALQKAGLAETNRSIQPVSAP
jgi:CheY-like chemotaxis protein